MFIAVATYIRKNIKKEKGKTYISHALVESLRTPKGPREKLVCTLGDLRRRSREEWLKLAHKVENALVGQGDLFDEPDAEVEEIVRKVKERRAREKATAQEPPPKPGGEDDLVAVHTDQVATERLRSAGHVHVGYQFWRRRCAWRGRLGRSRRRPRNDGRKVLISSSRLAMGWRR